MFYKILLVSSLATISSGATNPHKRSNEATYSQSFVREDVPLSYKYSAVHHYVPKRIAPEEPKFSKKHNKPNFQAQEFDKKNIQFAPLPNQKEHSYETTAQSPIPKENRYELPAKTPLYTSVFHNTIPEYQQYDYKLSENSAPSTINKDNLEPKPLPIEAKNLKPITYKPHVNHNIEIQQSPHVSPLNNYYENMKYPYNQEQVKTETAPNLDTGDIWKYFNVYQHGLYPEQQAATATTTENPENSYLTLENSKFFLPKEEVPSTLHASSMYWSLPVDPRLAYYTNYKSAPLRTYGADTKKGKFPKYSRYNYVRFQPKKYPLFNGS